MRRFRPTLMLAAALTMGFGVTPTFAQESNPVSIITGKVIDEKTGQALSEVTVQIVGQEVVGTRLAALTGMDGRYRLVNVRPGTVTITVRRIGYTMKQITGLQIEPGKMFEQDIALAPGSTQLAAIVVSADRERASIADALESQRTALGVLSSITREQIQKSPDGDAAQVARRASGVTIADNKTVNARGLGGRYVTATLNGARIPSPEPEQKQVPLDLFPSSLLDGITVSKTFTPDQPGDFSGAQVEIRTREFPADRTATYTLGSGMNTAMTGRTLPVPMGAGGEAFAFANASRGLPGLVRAGGDLSNTTFQQRNAMINSFRNIWQPASGGAAPNGSMSATFGGSELVGNHRFGYIASGTYSLTREVRLDETRSLARPSGTGAVESYNTFTGTTAGTSALWGGVVNLSTLVGTHSRLLLNNTYSRTADNDARVERGFYEDLSIPVAIDRMDYVQRSVWSSQLVGERETDANRVRFTVTGSGVSREQPDRSEYVSQIVTDASGHEKNLWVNTLSEAAVRTFSDLAEQAIESGADFQHKFGALGMQRSVKVGVLGRLVDRDAQTNAYSIYSFTMSDSVRALPPEVLFGGVFTQPDSTVMSLRSLAQGGSYSAKDYLAAGYGMYDGYLSDRWRLTAGARYEFSLARVNAVSTINEKSKARRQFNDVLPSLALTYVPSNRTNVRVSLTRTLARPEYRELAALRTRDVLGGVDVRGNPELIRTLIDNADVRWEFYPERGEVLSVGLFAKQFHNPIERVFLASNTNSLVTYLNAQGGEDLGVELEARRNLGRLADVLSPFTAFTNLTFMRSRVSLGEGTSTATNPTRAMAGQAPYIVNGGLTYATGNDGNVSATLLFNRIGERISNAGELPLPDVVEAARNTLDLSLRFPLLRGMSGRLDAKNLLDSPFVERQGAVIRERYNAGRVLQAAITWH